MNTRPIIIQTRRKIDSKPLLCALALLALRITPAVAGNDKADPGLVPINAQFHGLTYGEWIVQWNQWYYDTIRLPNTAFYDRTGDNFATGQSGPVWFLPWAAFKIIDRSITIPAGSSILFPVRAVDALFQLPANATDEQIAAKAEALLARTAALLANVVITIDDLEVADPWRYQVVSPTFDVDLPGGSLNSWNLPAGRYGPDIAAGLFYLLHPLSVGQHTIHYSMDFVNAGPFTGRWDVTYHVSVVPHAGE